MVAPRMPKIDGPGTKAKESKQESTDIDFARISLVVGGTVCIGFGCWEIDPAIAKVVVGVVLLACASIRRLWRRC